MTASELFLWLHCLGLEWANQRINDRAMAADDAQEVFAELELLLAKAQAIIDTQQRVIVRQTRELVKTRKEIEEYREKEFRYNAMESLIQRGIASKGESFLQWLAGDGRDRYAPGSVIQMKEELDRNLNEFKESINKYGKAK